MAIRDLPQLRVLPSAPATPVDGRASVDIYRPFFLAGILSVLTAGCALGAIALLGIGLQGSFTAGTWTPYVLAHANSQLYGWVGFFVMGFALQQHAPRESRKALFHRLAAWSLWLMAAGIALRFVAEPMVAVSRSPWLAVGVLSGLLQIAAIGCFVANTALTRFKTGEGLTWPTKFVFVSLFWWAVVAIAEPFYFALSHQADSAASVQFVAQWFPPYREAQFLGFVAMMIFGVALVKMHTCFGARKACPYFGNAGFALWNVGLLARMAGWVLYFEMGMAASSSWLYYAGGVLLALGAISLVMSTRMFRPTEFSIPSHKFVRAAFGSLIVAGGLMVAEPAHLMAIGEPFSHAYIGAIRHAVTVGFISQMILGVGLHVVSRMRDIPAERVPSLVVAFLLLNLGNAARVGLEIATDYTGRAFLPMGLTGFVELCALLIWAAAVGRMMLSGRSLRYAA